MKFSEYNFLIIAGVAFLFVLMSCSGPQPEKTAPSDGKIFLYGETHGSENIMVKEFELWNGYYLNGMRHLFVEYPHYTAEFLNVWMAEETDDILNAVYDDWEGTQVHVPATKDFFKRIKNECPETVFHGTDVGHQYNTAGERYLSYLKENGMGDSAEYELTRDVIEQGKRYYRNGGGDSDYVYRENKMAENFIREFDKLNGESVMGIYGSMHIAPEGVAHNNPVMANQLKGRYGENIRSEDISSFALGNEPLRVDIFTIGGTEYEALYFGEFDISSMGLDFIKREFWRLEDAYDDFADKPKTGDVLPYNNYPMPVEARQVFVIDYTKNDGSAERLYYRSDGNEWNGRLTTEQFVD